jgi:glycosyltransferase involved in cell wall biosynthesis
MGNEQPSVAVLMSTYNGSRFLQPQLDSLLAQDYPSITVCIRDDGSTDGTREILSAYAIKDKRVSVLTADNVGCAQSFLMLLQLADSDIVMFCDQDDVWLPDKVSRAVRVLVAAGVGRAVLYHSDLVVVDENLSPFNRSFMLDHGLKFPRAHALGVLAIQNCVVGCTVAMTAELVRRANVSAHIGAVAVMHDWWLAMFAACQGEIVYSADSRILYRQHGANVSGAIRRPLLARIRLQFSSAGVARIRGYRVKVARQAREFVSYYGQDLSVQHRAILDNVAKLDPECGFWPVVRCQIAGIRFQNMYMNLALLFSALADAIGSMLRARRR